MATPLNNVARQGRGVSVALGEHGRDVAESVDRRMHSLAAQAAVDMKRLAPKFQSGLVNAIKSSRVAEAHYRVDVGVDYGAAVDQGRRPGKGLPWLDSPGALGVLGWLKRRQGDHLRAFVGPLTKGDRNGMALNPKKGSKLATEREADLRTRYFAFSRSVKRKGIRAQPFFTPVAERLEREAPQVLAEQVQACVARAGQALQGVA